MHSVHTIQDIHLVPFRALKLQKQKSLIRRQFRFHPIICKTICTKQRKNLRLRIPTKSELLEVRKKRYQQMVNIMLTSSIPEGGFITNKFDIYNIVTDVLNILKNEPTVVDVFGDTAVFGDIHGDYVALQRFLQLIPDKNCTKVFLGDYVDRGKYSLDVICLLFMLKILEPEKYILLRGNHESVQMSNIMGEDSFYREIREKFGETMADTIFENFNYLPISCIIDSGIICVHGGICEELQSVNQLRNIQKPYNIDSQLDSLECKVLWSDPLMPITLVGDKVPNETTSTEFLPNQTRGTSCLYGKEALRRFLHNNNLQFLFRGHQKVPSGALCCLDSLCITVFSCRSDISYSHKNASIIIIKNKCFDVLRYTEN